MVDISISPGIGNNFYSALTRIKVNGKPVLTNLQLSNFYLCDIMRLIQNFNNNKDKFIEGVHYFKLEGADLKNFLEKNNIDNFYMQNPNLYMDTFNTQNQNSKNLAMIRKLYLWTDRGAARHAKILGSDRAWEVFDLLEENYFNPPNNAEDFTSEKKFNMLVTLAKLTQNKAKREILIDEATKIILGKKFNAKNAKESVEISLDFVEKFIEKNCIFYDNGKIMRKEFLQRLQKEYPEAKTIKKQHIVQKVISINGIQNKLIGGTGANGFIGIDWKN